MSEIKAGSRVKWTDPDGGNQKLGTVLNQTDEDAFFVVFDDGSEAGAYEHELTALTEREQTIEMIAEVMWNGDGAPEMDSEQYEREYKAPAAAQFDDAEAGTFEPWWKE